MAMLDMGSALGSILGYGAPGGTGGMENSSIAGGGGGGGLDPTYQQKMMQALGGIKAMAPVSPIMSGGVAGGGQNAPGANAGALMQSSPLLGQLLAILGRQGGMQPPGSLGQTLRQGVLRV